MNQKRAESLKEGAAVMHKRYGRCMVREVLPGFGPTIRPTTPAGLAVLARDSGTGIPDYLCTDVRNLSEADKEVEPLVRQAMHESQREHVGFEYRYVMLRQFEHERNGRYAQAQECAAIRHAMEQAACLPNAERLRSPASGDKQDALVGRISQEDKQ